ncbi:MAG: acyltransferase domain-containing protein, partial [Candidatus Lindowbacteria bacterium]|nr:acyltransferase domain-containing protein [Candidatus Lindowbacteria bacterium]
MSIENKVEPIAVVGTGVIFPGSTSSPQFWQNIVAAHDYMQEVPKTHWLVDDYTDKDTSAEVTTHARRGAFIPDVAFDPIEFGMPPNTLPSTDSVQLLSLLAARDVLQNTVSYQEDQVDSSRISVILGAAAATELVEEMSGKLQRPIWVKSMREAGIPGSQVQEICNSIDKSYSTWTEATFPGLLGNVIAGRICNRFDLGGTNCTIDAACASSLGAISMAVAELRSHTSDLVITGGTDALNNIFMYMCFSKTQALSPTNDCRPFSDDADGTMLGEGIGLLAFRRLSDAERDGDRIYAVVRNIGSSSDGRAKSIYAPVSSGQANAVKRAYEGLDYGIKDVGLIEAHGTATGAGDVAEFEGLRLSHPEGKSPANQIALGSVKSQIGHTKGAVGAASLFKIVMALHHKVLPPTIKVNKPNPKLQIESSPFYLNTEARPWISDMKTARRGSVSSFGFGGSNFHVTVEEYNKETPPRYRSSPWELLVFGADSAAALGKLATEEVKNASSLGRLAQHSAESFKFASSFRLAVVASSLEEATSTIEKAVRRIEQVPTQNFSDAGLAAYGTGKTEGKTAFLFPGQGSQYTNMGSSVLIEFDHARAPWDRAADQLFEEETAMHDVVFPVPVFSKEDRDGLEQKLRQTEWAQPALGLLSLSYLELLERLGIHADCAAGHSYGELAALNYGGAFESESEFLKLSRKRGESARDAGNGDGAMSAVFCERSKILEVLVNSGTGVIVANDNSPGQCVISGTSQQIQKVEKELNQLDIRTVRLNVSTAFHSPMMEDGRKVFEATLNSSGVKTPRLPVYSNVTAAEHSSSPDVIRTMLAEQLTEPVRFREMILKMYEDGVRQFIEIGPGAVLTGLVKEILSDKEINATSLDNKSKDSVQALLSGLRDMIAAGQEFNLGDLWNGFEKVPEIKKSSPATVWINGANYQKPYPPEGGTPALPKPNQDVPASQKVAASRPATATQPHAEPQKVASPIAVTSAA